MKHKAMAVQNYNFTPQHKLFLDANIWFYLYGPKEQGNYWVQIYSNAFKHILKANSRIYIDVLVVSEFINSYAIAKWRIVASHIGKFKKFRNSPEFKPVAKDIEADVKRVLEHCTRIESGFTTLQIDDLLALYGVGDSDFNDQVITELCKSNGFKLITNDKDFRTQDIPVLTANKRLLR